MATNPFTTARIKALTERIQATTRQQLVTVTTQRTAEIQATIAATLGGPAPTRRYVDGTEGKPLAEVQHVTLTEFHTIGLVVDAALQLLIERSPYGPDEDGHYQDDHWLYVNGTRRDAGTAGKAVDIAPGDEVVLINTRPYARLIEGRPMDLKRRRLTDRRPGLSAQAPNGVYEISARDLQRRFGRLATFTFGFRTVEGETKGFPSMTIKAVG